MVKTFISFLGTTSYLDVYYNLEGRKSKFTPFIQEALIDLLIRNNEKPHRIIVFLTDKARKINWEDKEEKKGLLYRLKQMGFDEKNITDVSIPEGKEENEIREIFMSIFNSINNYDEIYFDITHSFRSLPLLSMVALIYAMVLKKINIRGIYYGAFEYIGNRQEVANMSPEHRNCPIFDLTPYIYLVQWCFAVEEFTQYGISNRLKQLTIERINPILKSTKGKNIAASSIRQFIKDIDLLTEFISTCRGNKLLSIKIKTLDSIDTDLIMPEIKPLLNLTMNKISGFNTDNLWKKGIEAVNWCIQHNLIQQGYTILQEIIKKELANYISLKKEDIKYKTEFVSQFLQIAFFVPEKEWKGELGDNKEYAIKLKKIWGIPGLKLAKVFKRLSAIRNDINHFGLKPNAASYKKLKDKIKEIKNEVEESMTELFSVIHGH